MGSIASQAITAAVVQDNSLMHDYSSCREAISATCRTPETIANLFLQPQQFSLHHYVTKSRRQIYFKY